MTVWIYVDTSKLVGDRDHLKVFADQSTAEVWFKANDPEVARPAGLRQLRCPTSAAEGPAMIPTD